MLVGDVLQAIREAITDQPQTLPNPTAAIAASATGVAGSTLPAGNYYLNYTFRTPWGETLVGVESSVIAVGAGQGIQVTGPAIPPSASVIRVYFTLAGGASGSEQQFAESATLPFTISAPGLTAVPPIKNSAYLPDTDGDAVNSSTLYRWFNDALKIASQVCEGLPDYAGVTTISGQAAYIVPGQWRRVSTCWYDGYPLAMDDQGNFFRRNPITASILASVACSVMDSRMMFEVWPQPSRTAASTSLASQLALADTSAVLTNAGGILATAGGFLLIGSEIVSWSSILGNTAQNLIRGLGGTSAAVWPAGTVVKELNLFFSGWRAYNPSFVPGNALLAIPIPVGWETMLPIYGLARMKLAEQNVQEYTALEKHFVDMMQTWWKTNKIVVGPRQIGEQTNSLEVLPSFGGGWVVP